MKAKLIAAIAALPLVAIAAPVQAQGQTAKAGAKIANSYICVFDKSSVSRANVPDSRVDELLRVLAAEWVTDVPTLLKTLQQLEKSLPAGGAARWV